MPAGFLARETTRDGQAEFPDCLRSVCLGTPLQQESSTVRSPTGHQSELVQCQWMSHPFTLLHVFGGGISRECPVRLRQSSGEVPPPVIRQRMECPCRNLPSRAASAVADLGKRTASRGPASPPLETRQMPRMQQRRPLEMKIICKNAASPSGDLLTMYMPTSRQQFPQARNHVPASGRRANERVRQEGGEENERLPPRR